MHHILTAQHPRAERSKPLSERKLTHCRHHLQWLTSFHYNLCRIFGLLTIMGKGEDQSTCTPPKKNMSFQYLTRIKNSLTSKESRSRFRINNKEFLPNHLLKKILSILLKSSEIRLPEVFFFFLL